MCWNCARGHELTEDEYRMRQEMDDAAYDERVDNPWGREHFAEREAMRE